MWTKEKEGEGLRAQEERMTTWKALLLSAPRNRDKRQQDTRWMRCSEWDICWSVTLLRFYFVECFLWTWMHKCSLISLLCVNNRWVYILPVEGETGCSHRQVFGLIRWGRWADRRIHKREECVNPTYRKLHFVQNGKTEMLWLNVKGFKWGLLPPCILL